MLRFIYKLSFSCLCVLLAACANPSLENLRSAAPKGTEFQNELARQYLRYAESKQQANQPEKATLFADKGLRAAYGNDEEPEALSDWNVSSDSLPYFTDMRENIVALLTDTSKKTKPEAAAGAVFFYDCWLDQTVLAADSFEAGYCQSQMELALGELRSASVESVVDQSEGGLPPMDAGAKERYLVYFALERYELDASAARTVETLFKSLGAQTKVAIAVNGHTDTSGDDRYNMMLSNQRANAVKAALIKLGVSEAQIQTYGFGETDLLVPTADDTYEPKNRRVEIVVN